MKEINNHFFYHSESTTTSSTASIKSPSMKSKYTYHKSKTIANEIHNIEQQLYAVEYNNLTTLYSIKNSILERYNKHYDMNVLTNTQDARLDSLINQIYVLQMKQFAESIQQVLYDKQMQMYVLNFDPNEHISSIVLDCKQYHRLLSFRDPLNNVCIYELFQEKVHSYYNENNDNDSDKHNINSNSNVDMDKITIPKNINIDYAYCHYCKQRKPLESMLQCKYCNVKNKKNPKHTKVLTINGITIIKSKLNNNTYIHLHTHIENKSILIKNHSSSYLTNNQIQEYIDYTEKDESHYKCKRIFCHFCLKASYDTIIEEAKKKKDWLCPYCISQCFCSRCIRYEKILKLIANYISIGGDITNIYAKLISKDEIISKLKSSLIVHSILYIIHNPTITIKESIDNINQIVTTGNNSITYSNNITKVNKLIQSMIHYKNILEKRKDMFNSWFHLCKVDKCLLLEEHKHTHKHKHIGKKRLRKVYKLKKKVN